MTTDRIETAEELDAKRCCECGQTRALVEFWTDRRRADGREDACAECRNARRRGKYPPNTEGSRRYRREHAERFTAQRRAWEARNPEKARAQRQVRNAVRDGRLTKPKRCETCGTDGTLHGHHDDYSNPLDVRWFCPACHKEAHRVAA